MKNNLLKGALFVALAGLITFTGCKYEDGPGISLRSKRDRFSNEWIVKSYMRQDSGAVAVDQSDRFTDTLNSISLGNIVFLTTRTGRFELLQMPDSAYTIFPNNFTHPTFVQMTQLTVDLAEALGMPTSHINAHRGDTSKNIAPRGTWTFDDKSNSVQMKADLAHIDSIPNVTYDIVELREDALKLKWVDEAKVTRTIGFEPINDEDFFL